MRENAVVIAQLLVCGIVQLRLPLHSASRAARTIPQLETGVLLAQLVFNDLISLITSGSLPHSMVVSLGPPVAGFCALLGAFFAEQSVVARWQVRRSKTRLRRQGSVRYAALREPCPSMLRHLCGPRSVSRLRSYRRQRGPTPRWVGRRRIPLQASTVRVDDSNTCPLALLRAALRSCRTLLTHAMSSR